MAKGVLKELIKEIRQVLEEQKNALSSLKFVLTLAVIGLLVIISLVDPHNLNFTGESRPDYPPETKAAAFAFVAAVAAFPCHYGS